MHKETLRMLIFMGGLGHIALSAGSLMIPKSLKWKEHLSQLQPLLKQMFWTYAAYILVINVWFGIISLAGTDELLNGSFLATSITLFISMYWLARIVIQFFYFDKTHAPKGILFTIGEIILIVLFFAFTLIYFAAFLHNMLWI